ncbi:Na(+)/H(+) antiporter NhaC [anaerobic digester metagenome]
MSIKRFSTYTVFGTGITFSAIWACLRQKTNVASLMSYIASGYNANTGIESLDNLLSRGGISSMLEMIGVVILAGILCGLFKELKIFSTLVDALGKQLHSPNTLVSITLISSFAVALATGNQYTPIALPAIAFLDAFDKADLHPTVLGRSIEDMGAVLPAIIPWGLAAIFYVSTLGIPALQFAPYAIFCWVSPLVALVNAILGIGLLRKNDPVKYHPFQRRKV